MGDLLMKSSAIVSDDGRFRYALTRQWGDGPRAVFIMLNPSTADAEEDDPTIRRCISFAKREGCGSLRVENLFAFRATAPDQMFAHSHTAVGGTDQYIREAVTATWTGPVIAAWGGDKRAAPRAHTVHGMLFDLGCVLKCLGKTKAGAPRHPLYVKGDAALIDFP